MGRQIIKEPSGKYAVWSSIVDDFILLHATKEEIIEEWVREEADRIREGVNAKVAALEAGTKPYYQFTMTWEEALNWRRDVHPDAKDIN